MTLGVEGETLSELPRDLREMELQYKWYVSVLADLVTFTRGIDGIIMIFGILIFLFNKPVQFFYLHKFLRKK
jgi:hypothetical protein